VSEATDPVSRISCDALLTDLCRTDWRIFSIHFRRYFYLLAVTLQLIKLYSIKQQITFTNAFVSVILHSVF
jgi:hypothetical protein